MAAEPLQFTLVDAVSFDSIPAPARPGARCQTCDYWERIDGKREAPAEDATDAEARAKPQAQPAPLRREAGGRLRDARLATG